MPTQSSVKQERRSIDEIMQEVVPAKSAKNYAQTWDTFRKFLGHEQEPTEQEYMQYLDFLKMDKGYKASSFWCLFSKLNGMHHRRYGTKLQQYPRIKLLLKSFEQGYVRKVAKVFSRQEVEAFLRFRIDGPYWMLRKAFAAITYVLWRATL